MRLIISSGKGLSWMHVSKDDMPGIDKLCKKLNLNKTALLNIFQKGYDVFMFHDFYAIVIPVIHEFEGNLKQDSILVLMKKNLIVTLCYSLSQGIIDEVVNTIRAKRKQKLDEMFILRRVLQEAHENTVKLIDKREEVIDSLVESAAILKIEIDKLVQLIMRNRRYLSKIKEVLHDFKRVLFDFDEELPIEFEKSKDLRKIYQLSAEISEELGILYTLEQKLSEALSLHDLLLSNRMNMLATKLTVIAALFLVPSLISGIFGMNNFFDPIDLFKIGSFAFNTLHLELSVICLAMLALFYIVYKKRMLKF